MTNLEFREFLRIMKISNKEFIEKSGVAQSTFWRWKNGELPVPDYVDFICGLIFCNRTKEGVYCSYRELFNDEFTFRDAIKEYD